MPINFAEWLKYLESLPSGLSEIREDNFEKIKKLAESLGVTKFSGKVITIAGTNGKGSCVAFLENILIDAGYKVGAYISPHLLRYNERIRLNGHDIDERSLLNAFEIVYGICNKNNIVLNYFEFSTIAALLIFKQQKLDFLLLEVGLGGRIDPVNIVDPDIAVITTISLDHVEQLGNTRESIGREKAGIMRPQSAVVCGDANPPLSIYSCAKKIKAKLYCLNKDFYYYVNSTSWIWVDKDEKKEITDLPIPKLPVQNAATSLKVISLLKKIITIDDKAVVSGLQKASLPGRFQFIPVMGKKCEFIVDVAHNPESAVLLAQKITKRQEINFCKRSLAVVSMLKDKDIIATLQPLVKIIDVWYIAELDSVRASTLEQLQDALRSLGVKNFFNFISIENALRQVIADCDDNRQDRYLWVILYSC